ncbi:SDR family oxidoreductase [Ferrovibrio sp. MS7]|uniref:SDR family oxidoreductase n=1 Tax=Ferrovibrio plantarum TaxID=3119164 RepID=UPI0031346D26
MPTVFITGASRGIGLEFAKHYAGLGWQVIAGVRAPDTATALSSLSAGGNVSIERLDVTDDAAVDAVAAKLKGHAIELLINNAGIYGDRDASLSIGNFDTYRRVLATNIAAPMKVALSLLPNLKLADGAKILTISSRMGSIGLSGGGSYVYRSSKAGVNAAMHALALDLKPQGITAIVAHPGWVRTDMGGSGADISVQESVAGLTSVIARATLADSGKFFNYDGAELAW